MRTPFPTTKLAALATALLVMTPASKAFAAKQFTFPLVVSAGAQSCLPHAAGQATITGHGAVEHLHVVVAGLPPKTDFDFFLLQTPSAPLGLSWYQGDIETGYRGIGVGDFVGRFSIETFIVAPSSTQAPVVFGDGPFPDGNLNPASPPIHTYHLGLWFNSPNDAMKAGCPATVTPFNGNHQAGIQVINSANFPILNGPLRSFNP